MAVRVKLSGGVKLECCSLGDSAVLSGVCGAVEEFLLWREIVGLPPLCRRAPPTRTCKRSVMDGCYARGSTCWVTI